MVNASRSQSHEAPRRLSWLMIVPPDWSFHSHTLAKNASRPISRRVGALALASSRSTTICVAIPAWSVPTCHSVSWPRIRCQRIRMSCSVLLNACPMCSEPVTLGGGIMMENASAPALALAPARPTFWSIHSVEMRASASAALKVFSMGILISCRGLTASYRLRMAWKSPMRARGGKFALWASCFVNPKRAIWGL